MVPISYYLILSGILFACGVTGFLIKRNIISIFMSIELMLNGVNLSFVAFAAQWHALSGQIFVFFVMVVAAAEAAVGLAIIICGLSHARNFERRPGGPAQTMTSNLHLWLIPVLPLVGAAINGLFGKKFSRQAVVSVALLFSGAAFALVLSVAARFSSLSTPHIEFLATWIRAGSFQADFAFYLDQLSLIMLLVVTGVGFLIHIYSVGYMWEEAGFYRFFAYLNLFMFFMLTLVLSSNYLLMFVGWEGVGLASYLLIGFWFTKDSAASAGKKAFIVNRVGDFGFLIALFLLIKHFGSLNFETVFQSVSPMSPESGGAGLLTAIGLLLMVGAAGKSAQIPLYVWLPDAMEGPTPVSALIHAATMVTAGVYMVAQIARDLRPGAVRFNSGSDRRHTDRLVCRDHRHRADRYQESSGLLHDLAAGLHVHGLRRGRVFGGSFPPDDACLFQRAAVSGRGLGDPRGGGRAGHAAHGRIERTYSLDVLDHDCRHICDCRISAVRRILQQG